jgi:HAMP domain-containing protein
MTGSCARPPWARSSRVARPARVRRQLGRNLAVHRVRGLTTAPGMLAVDDEAATDEIGWCGGKFIRSNEQSRRTPGRHGRGSPCQLAVQWPMIARMAGDRARGGGEPRAGCRGTATGVSLVGVDAVSMSLPQTSETDLNG